MKNEKLELLLNKVVEFNQPDVAYYKGFLYKDSRGYYIKVVEGILGTFSLNDKVRLKEGDENYIIQAEKPKLMRISLKSWHYRLIKWVLEDNVPTPKTMQNGCPYFWLLIFSLIVSPLVLLYRAIVFMIFSIPDLIVSVLEKIVNHWIQDIEDAQAYEYYYNGSYSKTLKMPVTSKIYFEKSYDSFIEVYMREKYNLDSYKNPEEFSQKMIELSKKWEAWGKEIAEKRKIEDKIRQEKYAKELKRIEERERRELIRKEKWDRMTKPLANGWSKFVKTFTVDPKNWKDIIRKTKQFVGAIITVILLAVTYFVINFVTYGLTIFVDIVIKFWYVFVLVAAIVAIVALIYFIYILITGWLQGIVSKYQIGKKVWYIEPLIYLVWYPVKYIVLFIAYAFYYVIAIPVKFIFYDFLWKLILVKLGLGIWKVLSRIGKSIGSSTGIFGEYFGLTYSAYCPGIEWVDTNEGDVDADDDNYDE